MTKTMDATNELVAMTLQPFYTNQEYTSITSSIYSLDNSEP